MNNSVCGRMQTISKHKQLEGFFFSADNSDKEFVPSWKNKIKDNKKTNTYNPRLHSHPNRIILNKGVDLCYRSQPFINVTKRIELLFELYDKYTSGMFGEEKKKGKK